MEGPSPPQGLLRPHSAPGAPVPSAPSSPPLLLHAAQPGTHIVGLLDEVHHVPGVLRQLPHSRLGDDLREFLWVAGRMFHQHWCYWAPGHRANLDGVQGPYFSEPKGALGAARGSQTVNALPCCSKLLTLVSTWAHTRQSGPTSAGGEGPATGGSINHQEGLGPECTPWGLHDFLFSPSYPGPSLW